MIRVDRSARTKPLDFDVRAKALWDGYRVERKTNRKLTITHYWSKVRPRLRDDARALADVFAWKCAFCEAHMSHVSNPHVEHYRPKGQPKFAHLAFAWDNWLLSCGKCNEKKWSHFPMNNGVPCLLDPTTDDPATHITFTRSRPVWLTERGRDTVSMLKLDREPLEASRDSWLSFVDAVLLLFRDPATRDQARELLVWMMQPDAPYSAMTRCYLLGVVPKLASPAVPHSRIILPSPYDRIRTLVQQHAGALQALV